MSGRQVFLSIAVVLVGLSMVAGAPWSACAQGRIVYDPRNHAQNVVSAARALEQIRNQLAQIEQQAQMLARNPLQLSPDLSRSIDEARLVLDAAEGLAFDIRRIGADLEAIYPQTWEAYDLDGVLRQSDQWLLESRTSVQTAMEMQARAAQSLGRTRARIATALGSSASAEGQTSAVQAGNQLLGIQATQLTEIHALLIAQGRALEAERLERLAREDRAREIRRRAFPSAPVAAPPPARNAF